MLFNGKKNAIKFVDDLASDLVRIARVARIAI